jgi:hypothetical protein
MNNVTFLLLVGLIRSDQREPRPTPPHRRLLNSPVALDVSQHFPPLLGDLLHFCEFETVSAGGRFCLRCR